MFLGRCHTIHCTPAIVLFHPGTRRDRKPNFFFASTYDYIYIVIHIGINRGRTSRTRHAHTCETDGASLARGNKLHFSMYMYTSTRRDSDYERDQLSLASAKASFAPHSRSPRADSGMRVPECSCESACVRASDSARSADRQKRNTYTT